MNEVPFHAISVEGKPLIEYCDVSYSQTLGLFVRQRGVSADQEYLERTINKLKSQILNQKTAGFVRFETIAELEKKAKELEKMEQGSIPGSLTMVFNDQPDGPWFYKGIVKQLEQTYQNKCSILRHPSIKQVQKALINSDQADDLLFACHGEYYPDAPAASWLQIDSSQKLSFADLFSSMMKPRRSVVLGACESGLLHTELAAECMGLTSAFLSAGAHYVISSLWEVDARATVILLSRFYELVGAESHSIPEALNAAQRNLARMTREETKAWFDTHLPLKAANAYKREIEKMSPNPFAHPYYWAGFYVSGDV